MLIEIETVHQEVAIFVEQLPTMVQSSEKAKEAMGALATVTKKRKQIEDFFNTKFINPAKALWTQHRTELQKSLEPLSTAERSLRNQLIEWNTKENLRVQKDQEKYNRQFEKRVKLAMDTGKEIDDVKAPVMVPVPWKTTKVDEGAVTFRTVKRLVIVDDQQIPDQFMIFTKLPNKPMIQAALEANQWVPGCQIEEHQEVAVRASV